MKTIYLSLISILFSTAAHAQTQAEMNMEAKKDAARSDSILNVTYKKVLNLRKSDALFITNFKEEQRIWIKYRDAQLNTRFPKEKAGEWGTNGPLCYSVFLMQLTDDRVKELDKILNNEEGDVCGY